MGSFAAWPRWISPQRKVFPAGEVEIKKPAVEVETASLVPEGDGTRSLLVDPGVQVVSRSDCWWKLALLIVGLGGLILLCVARVSRPDARRASTESTQPTINDIGLLQESVHWPVIANSSHAGCWEEFEFIEHADDTVSLKSCRGTFLTSEPNGNITANADHVKAWERFRLIVNNDGTVSFQTYNSKYVVATEEGSLTQTDTPVASSHKFKRHKKSDEKYTLESCYGNFVTAVKRDLHLVVKQITSAEEGLKQIELGEGLVAFRCAQGTYLTAHDHGVMSANGLRIGKRETFKKIDNGDGTVSLQTFSGHYISASNDGRILSNANGVGVLERFTLIRRRGMNVALNKPVLASSYGWSGDPGKATDGKDNHGVYEDNETGVCAHTKNETPSWISVDLKKPTTVSSLMITGRACDWSGCQSYSKNWTIRVGDARDESDGICKANVDAYGAKVEMMCNSPHPSGRFITVWSNQWIVLCELEAYTEKNGTLLLHTVHGKYVAAVPASPREDSITDLQNAACPLKDLQDAGRSAKELKEAGFSAVELKAAGFDILELQLAGFGPEEFSTYKWITTTKAPLGGGRDAACMKYHRFVWPNLVPWGIHEFWSWPPRQSWEHIWNERFIQTPDDVCATPVMAEMPLGQAKRGFGADMNNFVNEAMVAMYTERPLSLCAPEGIRNLWAENFVDPGLHRCNTCKPPSNFHDVSPGAWIAGAKTSVAEAGGGKERELRLMDIKRFLYKKLFVLRPEIKALVDELQADLGLVHEPYVGVHIRRGDKLRESGFFRSTADFASEAQRLCETMGAKKIFLATDDATEIKQLRSRISSDIAVVAQERLPSKTYAERGGLKHTTEQVLINDIFLLIRADAYVGTASSNLDRFVWFHRDPTTQSISLDDAGDFMNRGC